MRCIKLLCAHVYIGFSRVWALLVVVHVEGIGSILSLILVCCQKSRSTAVIMSRLSVDLTTARFDLRVTHTFAYSLQQPFWNRWQGKKGHRKYSMINLHESMGQAGSESKSRPLDLQSDSLLIASGVVLKVRIVVTIWCRIILLSNSDSSWFAYWLKCSSRDPSYMLYVNFQTRI